MSNILETLPTTETIARIQERFVLLDTRFDSLVGSFQPDSATCIQKATDAFKVPLNQVEVGLYLEQIGEMQSDHWAALLTVFGIIVGFILIIQGLSIYRNKVDQDFKDSLTLLQENLNKQSSDIDIKFATIKSHNLILRKSLADQASEGLTSSELKMEKLISNTNSEIGSLKAELEKDLADTRTTLANSVIDVYYERYLDSMSDDKYATAFRAMVRIYKNLLLDYSKTMSEFYIHMRNIDESRESINYTSFGGISNDQQS